MTYKKVFYLTSFLINSQRSRRCSSLRSSRWVKSYTWARSTTSDAFWSSVCFVNWAKVANTSFIRPTSPSRSLGICFALGKSSAKGHSETCSCTWSTIKGKNCANIAGIEYFCTVNWRKICPTSFSSVICCNKSTRSCANCLFCFPACAICPRICVDFCISSRTFSNASAETSPCSPPWTLFNHRSIHHQSSRDIDPKKRNKNTFHLHIRFSIYYFTYLLTKSKTSGWNSKKHQYIFGTFVILAR